MQFELRSPTSSPILRPIYDFDQNSANTRYWKMCGELVMPTVVSPEMYENGFRFVDGKVVHLNRVFRTRSAKMERFLEQIPCSNKEEQVNALLMGKTNVERALKFLELSIKMSKLAEADFRKHGRKSNSLCLPFVKQAGLEEAKRKFMEMNLNSETLCSSWTKAYDEASGKNPLQLVFSKRSWCCICKASLMHLSRGRLIIFCHHCNSSKLLITAS